MGWHSDQELSWDNVPLAMRIAITITIAVIIWLVAEWLAVVGRATIQVGSRSSLDVGPTPN